MNITLDESQRQFMIRLIEKSMHSNSIELAHLRARNAACTPMFKTLSCKQEQLIDILNMLKGD